MLSSICCLSGLFTGRMPLATGEVDFPAAGSVV